MSGTRHQYRLRQYRAQDGRCWLCGECLDLFQPIHTYGSASWEHVIPRNAGGSDRLVNLRLTHLECNVLRGRRFIWSLERPRRIGPHIEKDPRKLDAGFTRQVLPHVIKTMRRLETLGSV